MVNPDLTQMNQDRVVEAVELNDGQVVYFDPFDSAGPGPDTRAYISGETIQGTVDGVPRTINLHNVKKIQFDNKPLHPASAGSGQAGCVRQVCGARG